MSHLPDKCCSWDKSETLDIPSRIRSPLCALTLSSSFSLSLSFKRFAHLFVGLSILHNIMFAGES